MPIPPTAEEPATSAVQSHGRVPCRATAGIAGIRRSDPHRSCPKQQERGRSAAPTWCAQQPTGTWVWLDAWLGYIVAPRRTFGVISRHPRWLGALLTVALIIGRREQLAV